MKAHPLVAGAVGRPTSFPASFPDFLRQRRVGQRELRHDIVRGRVPRRARAAMAGPAVELAPIRGCREVGCCRSCGPMTAPAAGQRRARRRSARPDRSVESPAPTACDRPCPRREPDSRETAATGARRPPPSPNADPSDRDGPRRCRVARSPRRDARRTTRRCSATSFGVNRSFSMPQASAGRSRSSVRQRLLGLTNDLQEDASLVGVRIPPGSGRSRRSWASGRPARRPGR